MANSTLPAVKTLPTLSTVERGKVLDLLFEPSPQLHALVVEPLCNEQFSSYADLIKYVGVQLTKLANLASDSASESLDEILGSHPRLGEKKIESEHSMAEQAHIKDATEEENAKLAALNLEYEEAYPGLRYV